MAVKGEAKEYIKVLNSVRLVHKEDNGHKAIKSMNSTRNGKFLIIIDKNPDVPKDMK